jgi:hypothetical protein
MDVTQVFGVGTVPATLGLTLYVAGYGLGPIIWSPMSEIPQIGRLWVYIGTLCMLHPHTRVFWVDKTNIGDSYIRPAADSDCVVCEFRHAPRLPVPDWFLWIACAGYGWGYHRGHVQASKASLRTRCLGHRSSLRASTWTLGRGICCRSGGLDVDDLGDHVALRVLSRLSILPPPRNERAEYLAQAHKATQEDYWRREVHVRAGYDVREDGTKRCKFPSPSPLIPTPPQPQTPPPTLHTHTNRAFRSSS